MLACQVLFVCMFLNSYSRNWTSVFTPEKKGLCGLSYLPSLSSVVLRYDLFVIIIINTSEIYNFIYIVMLLKGLNQNLSTQVHFILLVIIKLSLFPFSLRAMKCVYFLLNQLKTYNIKVFHGNIRQKIVKLYCQKRPTFSPAGSIYTSRIWNIQSSLCGSSVERQLPCITSLHSIILFLSGFGLYCSIYIHMYICMYIWIIFIIILPEPQIIMYLRVVFSSGPLY